MTVFLWDGHFDPDELAVKPVSIFRKSFFILSQCENNYCDVTLCIACSVSDLKETCLDQRKCNKQITQLFLC